MNAAYARYTAALAELVTADARAAEERGRVDAAFHASGEAARRASESEAASLDQLHARVGAFSTEVARLAVGVEGLPEPDAARPIIPAARLAGSLTEAERALRKVGESRDWLARYRAAQAQAPAPVPVATPAPAPAPVAPAPAAPPARRGIPKPVVIAIVAGAVLVIAVVVGILIGASA